MNYEDHTLILNWQYKKTSQQRQTLLQICFSHIHAIQICLNQLKFYLSIRMPAELLIGTFLYRHTFLQNTTIVFVWQT